jgi:beta-lactam-binding protein with PASTA domain
MIRKIFQFALLSVLLIVIGLVSALTTMHFAIHGAEVKVPDFRGMGDAEARRKAANMGLDISVEDRFYSAAIPESRIVTQSPQPGAIVRTGWHVRVSQSLGAQKVAVPNVVQQPERSAALAIRRASLQLGTIAHMQYGLAPPGTVMAQSPDAGSVAVDRPVVSLLLSAPLPPESSSYVMPDFTNQPGRTANAAVNKAGLKLAPPLFRQAEIPAITAIAAPGGAPSPPALPVMPGTVIAQEPVAGTRVDASTTVQFTLAQ